MTEALDIDSQVFWVQHWNKKKKRWQKKKSEHQQPDVSWTQLISLNYNHISDITVIFYVE